MTEQIGVLTHPEMGVYLGHCMGLGFWSKLDPAGQDSAPLFSKEEALNHILSWDGNNDPAEYTVVPVESVDPNYAHLYECVNAGLDPWQSDGSQL